MKVKEILEILTGFGKRVTESELIVLLDNIGIEKADLETEIEKVYVTKLSKKYDCDIKPQKPKKDAKVSNVKEENEEILTPDEKINQTEAKEQSGEVKTVKNVIDEEKIEHKKVEVKVTVQEESKKVQETKTTPTQNPKVQGTKIPAAKDLQTKSTSHKSKDDNIKAPDVKIADTKLGKVDSEVKLTRVYDDVYEEYEKSEKQYNRIKNVKKNKRTKENRQSNTYQRKKEDVVFYIPGMTAGQLADSLDVSYGEIVKKLVSLGYMLSATQPIDRDVIEILADDYGFTLKDKITIDITKFEDIIIEDSEDNLVSRPPIVTIMGHVDHGKTTLLDTIRSSRVTSSEAGGITQHIGAYQVSIKNQYITFIDTPGHAAFTEMRARGANITDIVIIVVAADDGVMPQTKEAIEHAVSAKVPIIVAVNKMDKPQANPDRVKQQLAGLGLVPSEWGGQTEYVHISALTGMGVDDLLETVLMISEMQNYRANPNRLGIGTVIEAQLTKGRGVVATLLVRNGMIKIGDPIVVGNTYGKIRAMQDETKANIKTAPPSKAVEVTGLVDVPQAGDQFMIFEDEKTAKLVSEERLNRYLIEKNASRNITLAAMFENLNDNNKEINLIIKGDVQGSVEALITSLGKLDVVGVKVNIIRTGVGAITDNDISLAIASKSIIIGFNIRPNSVITKQAVEKGIEIRLYNIIYKLLEDIEAAMKGMLDPVFEEKITGEVEVRKLFKVSKLGTIAGSYVTDGFISRNSSVRLIRDGVVIYTGRVGTLRRGQDDVKEVKYGYECGIMIENYNDIKEGDVIEAFKMEKVEE